METLWLPGTRKGSSTITYYYYYYDYDYYYDNCRYYGSIENGDCADKSKRNFLIDDHEIWNAYTHACVTGVAFGH